ncbi:unnamed protein product, partial [marine sediment metagenome]
MSHATSADTVESIEEMPHATAVKKPEGWDRKMGLGRRLAVNMAVQEGAEFVLHIDLDRLTHWILSYEDELIAVLKRDIPTHDFLIIGRTERAFGTHPGQQREPESDTNEAISRALDMRVDVTSGCSSFRGDVGHAIVRMSASSDFSSTDTEWPLLARLGGFTVGYIATEGLEFETPDRYADCIAEIGYGAWVRELFDDAQLAYRWQLARASIDIIGHTLRKYG